VTFTITALDFAIWRFNPAHRSGKINSHKEMIVVVDERNGVADIFMVANLMILCILVESGLVLADDGCVLEMFFLKFAPD